jgi:hypothetical protein
MLRTKVFLYAAKIDPRDGLEQWMAMVSRQMLPLRLMLM